MGQLGVARGTNVALLDLSKQISNAHNYVQRFKQYFNIAASDPVGE